MALTKLMHMKESGKKDPARHLKNGIAYIMKEVKTDNGRWIGGNAGTTAQEVFQTFMDTKTGYGKMYGRQGYHFVISFREDVPPEKVYEIMGQFCREYLQDHYDYVYSVHTDTEHVHAHVIFNSVSRSTGLKYHYKKGDWEKYIQPVTDKICQEHGFEKFEYEGGENVDYGEFLRQKEGKRNWRKIVRQDIDRLIPKVNSIEELCKALILTGYQVRKGFSQKHNTPFLKLTPAGGRRAVRTYGLGRGYSMKELQDRIKDGKNPFYADFAARTPRIKCSTFPAGWMKGTEAARRENFYPSAFQYYYIQRYCKNTVLYQYQNTRNYNIVRETEKLEQYCRYLLRNRIRSEEELKERMNRLESRQTVLDSERNQLYRENLSPEEQQILKEYKQLCSQRREAEDQGKEDKWEELDDLILELESKYALSQWESEQKEREDRLQNIRMEKSSLRKEKTILEQIQGEREEMKITWKHTVRNI